MYVLLQIGLVILRKQITFQCRRYDVTRAIRGISHRPYIDSNKIHECVSYFQWNKRVLSTGTFETQSTEPKRLFPNEGRTAWHIEICQN